MNIKQLQQKIKEGEGKWEPKSGLEFIQESEDDTIHCHCRRENEVGSAFLMKHSFSNFNWHISSSFGILETKKQINFYQLLIDTLELEVKIGVIEKEVKVEVEKIVADKEQEGFIKAYEKILLGRKITLE